MTSKRILLVGLILLTINVLKGQSLEELRPKINEILAHKQATVGVAITGMNPKDTLSVNGDKHLPMQSVFKYHLATKVLSEIDKGKFSLNQKLKITKEDVDNNLWSPIREKYPDGVELTIGEIIKYTVALSDNVGCDVLFRLVGGPKVVEDYMHKTGIKDIAIKHNETVMQANWDFQYQNWTTAKTANLALKIFYENAEKQLSVESHKFLWDILKGTKTGTKCLKGLLPENTIVAHKTGYSGRNKAGLVGARNNIGVVFLPNGNYFYVSVLVSDSKENSETNQKIIADVAKLAFDYFDARQ